MPTLCKVCANTISNSRLPVDSESLLRVATWNDHSDWVKAILIKGGDVNSVSKDGNTPLTRAVQNCSESLENLLIQAGDGVKGTDVKLCTALKKAVHVCSHNHLNMLLNEGADVNKVKKFFISPLMLACRGGCITCANVLLDAGADVDMVSNAGYTALIHTSASLNVNIVRRIPKAGSIVNQFNYSGRNAITFLVHPYRNFKKELVWTLYAAGESVNLFHTSLPDFLIEAKAHAETSLKGLCRETIRNHLIQPSPPHINLFILAPK